MKCFSLFILLCAICATCGDYYAAITGLESLLRNEQFLIENLENYIKAERYKSSYLKNYMNDAEQEMRLVKTDALDYYGNPLNAWRAVKRMTYDWRDYEKIQFNLQNEGEYENRIKAYENANNFTKPALEDLKGAAKGISRLQRTYKLQTSHFANGTIMGRKVSNEMTSSDCFALGWSLFVEEDYKNSATWLLEARARLSQEKMAGKTDGDGSIRLPREHVILESLVPATLQAGSTKLAFWLAKEHLALNPLDQTALANIQSVEQRLKAERLALARGLVIEPQAEIKRDTLTDLYEKTCSGELRPTPREQRKLRCRYETCNLEYCLIAPFKKEELSLDPFVAVYYDVIYDSEIENVFKAASDVRRSQIGGGTVSAVSDIRTSKNTWLWYHQNPFMQNIAWRLNQVTGLSLQSAEALQVANYGIGGHYGPHYDFFEGENQDYEGKGNRILTALFYINDVELGGATAFPYLKLAVPPVKHSLVVWYNLHRSLELDYRTKHAGCPVIKGSKWICNEWFHAVGQELLRPCQLKPDGHKSITYADINMWGKMV